MKKTHVIGGFLIVFGVLVFFALSQEDKNPDQPLEDVNELIDNGDVNLNDDPNNIPPQITRGKIFKNEEEVVIEGYSGPIMEPGISKDGNYMLFNDGPPDKDMHWAIRISDTSFKYMGRVSGINSKTVDGTPSFDLEGNLYYTSTVDYQKTAKSMWVGEFDNGKVTNIERVDGDIYVGEKPWFSLDPEISPDGDWLYYSEGYFDGGALPSIFNVRAARKVGDEYRIDESITENINTDNLEYAPSISADGLEIFFTRTNIKDGKPVGNGIYTAQRNSMSDSFGLPTRVDAIQAPFVEAPTISLDGRSLYYHKEVKGKFKLYRVTR